MRILYLLTQDLESPSGLGRYWPLASQMAKRGHTVSIAALHANYGALAQKRFRREGVEVWYVAPMHVQKTGNLKRYYAAPQLLWVALRATWALSRAALSIPADIVQIGKPHPMNGIAGLLAKALGRRVLLDCDDIETGVNRFGAAWQKSGVGFFERWLPRQVHAVTTHTHENLRRLRALGVPDKRLFYLSNGVDRERLNAPDEAVLAALRERWGLGGKKVVGYLGSMSLAGHPVDLLFQAFSLVLKSEPESALLLVGGGEDWERLQTLAAEFGIDAAARFVGRVPPEEVPAYYHLCDVSVDPVHDDEAARGRSPLKLFESWACGVPFVSCDVGDRRFLLGEPPAGRLAQAGDAASLAREILQVLHHPAEAETLAVRGRQQVAHFFWDQLAIGMETIYQQWAGGA